MGAAGNGRATRQRGVQEIVQARGVVIHTNNLTNLRTYKLTNLRTYKLTNLRTYELTLRVRASHFGLSSHKSVFKNCRQTIFKNKNDQDNTSGIKDLLNGKTLNDFSIMFDEAIDCVKGLDI